MQPRYDARARLPLRRPRQPARARGRARRRARRRRRALAPRRRLRALRRLAARDRRAAARARARDLDPRQRRALDRRPDDAPDNAVVQGASRRAREALGDALVDELAALPERPHDGDTLSATPRRSDVRSFCPSRPTTRPSCSTASTAARLVFGHTHLPVPPRSPPAAIELVNPGSVGHAASTATTRAAYALLHADGAVEHRRVAYDHAASAAQLRSLGGEWAEVVARRIERARPDPGTVLDGVAVGRRRARRQPQDPEPAPVAAAPR